MTSANQVCNVINFSESGEGWEHCHFVIRPQIPRCRKLALRDPRREGGAFHD